MGTSLGQWKGCVFPCPTLYVSVFFAWAIPSELWEGTREDVSRPHRGENAAKMVPGFMKLAGRVMWRQWAACWDSWSRAAACNYNTLRHGQPRQVCRCLWLFVHQWVWHVDCELRSSRMEVTESLRSAQWYIMIMNVHHTFHIFHRVLWHAVNMLVFDTSWYLFRFLHFAGFKCFVAALLYSAVLWDRHWAIFHVLQRWRSRHDRAACRIPQNTMCHKENHVRPHE